jgi:flagellar motor switch/type III secretory pathway protein FliN
MARILVTEEELEKLVQENAIELKGYLDIEYGIDICLGSTTMSVKKMLELKEGDCVPLDRPSSEYLIVEVEGVKIGEAEVVLTKSGTGARVVEVS